MELVQPSARYRDSYLRTLAAYHAERRHLSQACEQLTADFGAFVDGLLAKADPTAPRPEGRVPETTLWYVRGDEFLGRVAIRHALTPQLRRLGGHIGYDVAPGFRRQGHATRMLAVTLPVARRLGIDPALITCDAGNIASRRVIEANGGILFDRGEKLRFWVPTSNNARPAEQELDSAAG